MSILRWYRLAMSALAVFAEVVAGAVLIAQVLFLAFNCVQGLLGLHAQLQWLSEATEFGLLTLALFGAALALRLRAHQGLDVLSLVLSPRHLKLTDTLAWLLIAGFGVLFAHRGALYVLSHQATGATLASVQVAKWPFYLCYPISGALFALFALEAVLDLWWPARSASGGTGEGGLPA